MTEQMRVDLQSAAEPSEPGRAQDASSLANRATTLDCETKMKPENELAMIVAFYLSKFGESGLHRLGFQSYRQAFDDVGNYLGVKPNSVKNWRDEFDPYYDNSRKGWYQRKLRPSRRQVMLAFDELSEDALCAVVRDIISTEKRQKIGDELRFVLQEIQSLQVDSGRKESTDYVPRGPTGRMAEEFFISRQLAGLTPFDGVLKDRRDDGAGFDFEVFSEKSNVAIEIKGVSGAIGAVTFTDKEWRIANQVRDSYFLGLVIDVLESPRIGFVQNPAQALSPNYYAYTTITINWTVTPSQFANVRFF